MIRNILFDMGEVLIRYDTDIILDRYPLTGNDRELLSREVFQSVEWSMLDRGSLDDEKMLARVCGRLPERLHGIARSLVLEWDNPILPMPGMEEIVKALHKDGFRLFLLSNASARQHAYWPRIPGASFFEDTLISADVHLVKPQPEIYALALQKFGIRPEESVFIDDNTLNIEAALNAGMQGIVFHKDAQELRRKLAEIGVEVR